MIAFTACITQNVNAGVMIQGWDLVDSGKHMDYDASGSNHGLLFTSCSAVWNNYLGSSVIRKDAWNTICDCDVVDEYSSSVDWVGQTRLYSDGSGEIALNTYYFQTATTNYIKHVIIHELGHTLGCGDNYSNTDNVMYPTTYSSALTLSNDDKISVDAARLQW